MYKKIILNIRLIHIVWMIIYGFKYYARKIKLIFIKSFTSKEVQSFTYNLTPLNKLYLLNSVSIITGLSYVEVKKYLVELESNTEIKDSLKIISPNSHSIFSGRIINYLLIRAKKPKVAIENGIGKGINTLLMCEAIKKNLSEGFSGRYIGIDLDIDASSKLREFFTSDNFEFICSDALNYLTSTAQEVDFYFSDGCRTYAYEVMEFDCLKPKLSKNPLVITNKGRFSAALHELAVVWNKKYLYFAEEVEDHWYPGAHFGILF
jgi:hypothetical protein